MNRPYDVFGAVGVKLHDKLKFEMQVGSSLRAAR